MAVQVREVEKEKPGIGHNSAAGRKYTFYMPWCCQDTERMLRSRGHTITLIQDSAWDIALFTGGTDICPILYGERMQELTNINIVRDLTEVQFYRSLHHNRMKVGICRGAQMLNVLSGGRIWQHVNNHAYKDGHLVKMYDRDALVKMSSRHHQMMIPGSDAWVIGNACEATRFINESIGENEITEEQRQRIGYKDPEIVYYENTHSLCFQPHPEDDDDMCRQEFFDLIDFFWNDAKHEEALSGWDYE